MAMVKIQGWKKNLLKYDERLNFYCVKNCYWNVLSFYHIPHAPLYLNSELSMQLKINQDNPSDFTVNLVHDPLLKSQEWHEIQHKTTDLSKSLSEFEQLIEQNIPIVMAVDGYFLPYHEQFLHVHEQHSILLTGLNLKEGYAELIDYFPPMFYCGVIKLSSLNPVSYTHLTV